jgi:hypothetical protein
MYSRTCPASSLLYVSLIQHSLVHTITTIQYSEIPRILVIFDIVNLGEKEVRQTIRQHFYKHAHIKDNRIITMLLETGYIDLEDTLLQHKQKAQLMLLLQGRVGTEFNSKALGADATEEEQMQRWLH